MARTSSLRPTFHTRPPPPSQPTNVKLTDEEISHLEDHISKAFGWKLKPFQVAGIHAQLERRDLFIQASTGAGKTAIAAGPHLWPGSAGKTTIMVSPLLSLEEEMVRVRYLSIALCFDIDFARIQVQTFQREFKLKAVAVNSKNGACSPLVLKVCHLLPVQSHLLFS